MGAGMIGRCLSDRSRSVTRTASGSSALARANNGPVSTTRRVLIQPLRRHAVLAESLHRDVVHPILKLLPSLKTRNLLLRRGLHLEDLEVEVRGLRVIEG